MSILIYSKKNLFSRLAMLSSLLQVENKKENTCKVIIMCLIYLQVGHDNHYCADLKHNVHSEGKLKSDLFICR